VLARRAVRHEILFYGMRYNEKYKQSIYLSRKIRTVQVSDSHKKKHLFLIHDSCNIIADQLLAIAFTFCTVTKIRLKIVIK
jgi:hypothetical protein